jgi:hypothetical protein
VEGGSPRRAGNGEGVGGDVDDGNSSNKMFWRRMCGCRWATRSCGPPQSDDGAGAHRWWLATVSSSWKKWRKGKLISGIDGGSPVVEVWSKRDKGVLQSSSRRWLGRRRSAVVGRWQELTEDAGYGEKRSLIAISRWFDLDDVVAPSADEGRAIGPHGR